MTRKLIIVRGLPFCGKSYRANELKGDLGVVYSTDEYFYKVLKPECPDEYSFNARYLHDAHRWNLLRAQKSIEEGHPLIIIDNTNVTAAEPKSYVVYALPQGYEINIVEPTSGRWQEISRLLSDKKANKQALKAWAIELETGSKGIHNVPAWAIERMMWRWVCGLTVEQIVAASDLN